MGDNGYLKYLNKFIKIKVEAAGDSVYTYSGKVLDVDNSLITINDIKVGVTSIPILRVISIEPKEEEWNF